MRRVPGPLAVLILAAAVALPAPADSPASPSAAPSAKHRCKQKAKKRSAKQDRGRKKRCRKKRGATGPAAGKPGKQADPAGPSGPPGRLLATTRELSPTQLQMQLSRASLSPGNTIVEQYNAGEDPHNLIFERQGTVAFSFPTLDPGLTQRQTVNLARGTWTLYCSLLNHQSLGMQATLTVN
jgi:plastocyanin